MNLARYP